MKILLCFCGLMTCLLQHSSGQVDSTLNAIAQLPNRFLAGIHRKAEKLDDRLTRQSERYLEKLSKAERKLERKLSRTDPAAAARLFGGTQEKYRQLGQQLKDVQNGADLPLQGEYLANVDSVKSSLAFLQQNSQWLAGSGKAQQELDAAAGQFSQLRARFGQAGQINEFIRERKHILQNALTHAEENLGLNRCLDAYNRQVYYYSEQLREYKELLNDPDKLLRKALAVLNRIPAFQNYMKQYGQLAGLFGISADYGTPAGLDGLQTRAQVEQLLRGQVGNSSSGLAALQSSLQDAHEQLDQFKDKLSALGQGSGDMEMPDFRPNPQKTRSFLKRIEIGTNLQTTRASYFFPSTTDMGLSIGYRLNSRGTVGIGGSYKLGWGQSINHMKLSSQGASLRSFLDFQLKKSFYLSGGYELNYQQAFTSLSQLSAVSDWTRSGLVGISKIVSLKGRLLKKTKVQLLWDFLSYSQLPKTNPFKFRVGYDLK